MSGLADDGDYDLHNSGSSEIKNRNIFIKVHKSCYYSPN